MPNRIGSRVTVVSGLWTNVLGTVVGLGEGNRALVEFKACNSIAVEWHPIGHLVEWVGSSDV